MILTDEEWRDSEFGSHYGNSRSTFQVDHKGRIFVHETCDDTVIILNEAVDAPKVLPKVIALSLRALEEHVASLRLICDNAERWYAEKGWTGNYGTAGDLARIRELLPPLE